MNLCIVSGRLVRNAFPILGKIDFLSFSIRCFENETSTIVHCWLSEIPTPAAQVLLAHGKGVLVAIKGKLLTDDSLGLLTVQLSATFSDCRLMESDWGDLQPHLTPYTIHNKPKPSKTTTIVTNINERIPI